jgi:hypothetical protein
MVTSELQSCVWIAGCVVMLAELGKLLFRLGGF